MTIAGMTYRQLIDEVLAFQFAVGKYEPLTKRWLNTAQRKAVQQSEFRSQEETESYTTTSGDATLALPEDFVRLKEEDAIFDTGERLPLVQLSQPEYDALAASSGRPLAYTVVGDQITLYPSPDGSYGLSLRYWRLPQDMVADGDEPEIPPQYHDVLPAYAMQKAYARENDYAASRFWKEEWEAGVMKMRGEVQHDTFQGPRQVGGMWGSVDRVVRSVWR